MNPVSARRLAGPLLQLLVLRGAREPGRRVSPDGPKRSLSQFASGIRSHGVSGDPTSRSFEVLPEQGSLRTQKSSPFSVFMSVRMCVRVHV